MAHVRNKIDSIAYCKDILLDARERRLGTGVFGKMHKVGLSMAK